MRRLFNIFYFGMREVNLQCPSCNYGRAYTCRNRRQLDSLTEETTFVRLLNEKKVLSRILMFLLQHPEESIDSIRYYVNMAATSEAVVKPSIMAFLNDAEIRRQLSSSQANIEQRIKFLDSFLSDEKNYISNFAIRCMNCRDRMLVLSESEYFSIFDDQPPWHEED